MQRLFFPNNIILQVLRIGIWMYLRGGHHSTHPNTKNKTLLLSQRKKYVKHLGMSKAPLQGTKFENHDCNFKDIWLFYCILLKFHRMMKN